MLDGGQETQARRYLGFLNKHLLQKVSLCVSPDITQQGVYTNCDMKVCDTETCRCSGSGWVWKGCSQCCDYPMDDAGAMTLTWTRTRTWTGAWCPRLKPIAFSQWPMGRREMRHLGISWVKPVGPGRRFQCLGCTGVKEEPHPNLSFWAQFLTLARLFFIWSFWSMEFKEIFMLLWVKAWGK